MRTLLILFTVCLNFQGRPSGTGSLSCMEHFPSAEASVARASPLVFFPADDPAIQYMGRIDFSHPKLPRFWAPGVSISFAFKGNYCLAFVNDEMLYGSSHNYIEIFVDDRKPYRIQTRGRRDTIRITGGAASGQKHVIRICKDTESGIGYLEFQGITCEELLPPAPLPSRKIEFIGNSITCGTGMDLSEIPCDKGQWYDQHNAAMSYGPLTSRALNAQWHLTAVSGIGLIHSCCKMTITMPQVFDKTDLRDDSITWDFSHYRPDVVTICLGQNDGVQDSTSFCGAYVSFIQQIRSRYPAAAIVCLTSPMADPSLVAVMKRYLTGIRTYVNRSGDSKVYTFFYSKRYSHGCGGHPDLDEHRQIAGELTEALKKIMGW